MDMDYDSEVRRRKASPVVDSELDKQKIFITMHNRAKRKRGDCAMEGWNGNRGGYRNDSKQPRNGRYG